MTANPDSALRQALEKARDALAPLLEKMEAFDFVGRNADEDVDIPTSPDDLRRAREAHALITEALQQHNGEKP